MRIVSVNPATEQPIREYDPHSEKDIEKKLLNAENGFKKWNEIPIKERCNVFRDLAASIEQQKEETARLITEEMGKTIKESRAELDKCILLCNYYADNGINIMESESIETEYSKSYVTWRPLGTLLAIMPWNFPFWQVFRFGIPALLTGNVILLKHALNVPGCALVIEQLFKKSGFPDGALQNLFISNEQTSGLVEDKRIHGVTLTGGTEAGKAVAKIAGAHLKKTVMELGGSDPYVILADADIEKTVEACVQSRLLNAGQSCIAAKRFIVHQSVYDVFVGKLKDAMESKKFGDPFTEDTDIGPMAREDLRNKLHKQIQLGLIDGGKNILGCKIPVMEGFYYPPSVITDVDADNNLFKEEIFGPVAVVTKAHDEQHAIELANQTDYGLGAAIFTSDIEKGELLASQKIRAGNCFVNDYVKSDPRLPFGGIKDSGYGRELSWFGPREFANIKTVVVK